jgi:hypothetical protein
MNAVEIEAAVLELAAQPFDAAEFPFQFLAAFDKKETTLKRLRKGDSNKSDVPGAVLLVNNIHLAVCPQGQTRAMLESLKASPKTTAQRAKYVFATDGNFFEAEKLSGLHEPVADELKNLANHFGFFLELAGISTVREIEDNPIDVRATGRLNKLYVELLKLNPEWSTDARRHDMNHFMARLIFCFFAEHTDIFNGYRVFTDTIEQMSESNGSNTHLVMEAIFRAMNIKPADRAGSDLPNYAIQFPYVNGGLFAESTETPRFSQIARSYLLQAGSLEWQHINPDIFGSMIQAVADDAERGALGMHYTSVPNILKVLNPLFLDELRAQLDAAGDNSRMLLNLRRRLSRIRVFDPACGSGNFLVIAYKELRKIEAEINQRRGEQMRPTEISEKNFRGIEIRDFAAEIARLALVIAKYQCDVQHRGPLAAKEEFLPLNDMNWITHGNALQLDWMLVCPPEGTGVKLHSDDLFQTPLEQPEIDFENEGGEVFICGNPPYLGFSWQSAGQKAELRALFDGRASSSGFLDYVAGWFVKAADYGTHTNAATAFVATNSICQGQQVSILWPLIFKTGHQITFAHTSFKWANLASNKAGVTVVIVGISNHPPRTRRLFSLIDDGSVLVSESGHINAYLVHGPNLFVEPSDNVLGSMSKMGNGNKAVDGGHLLLEPREVPDLSLTDEQRLALIKRFAGSLEAINGKVRYCIWIPDDARELAFAIPSIQARIELVRKERLASSKKMTRDSATRPYAFQQVRQRGDENLIVVPRVSSESRNFLPVLLMEAGTIMSDKCFALYDAPLWNMALIASRLHWVWIGTVCVRMRTDFSYSNTLGWNTFPVPKLTEQMKADLTRCAEDILLARESHFPATIADLYDPDTMPENLRAAHEANDEVLERIYIGRRFRNDTERLEKLFEMYTKMTAKDSAAVRTPAKRATKRVSTKKMGKVKS